MPELPEVETIVRGLAPRILGRVIDRAELLHPPLLRRPPGGGLDAAVAGRSVDGLRRRGKMILVECAGGTTLVFHLKMTGQLLLSGPVPRDKHTHLALSFRDGKNELRFRDVRKFGFLLCVASEESSCGEISALGPEPLEITLPEFTGLLNGRRARVKSVLLDQSAIAGIGNIYADEMLFGAGIHPLATAGRLSIPRIARLHESMRKILTSAIAAKGSTLRDYRDAEGRAGSFQFSHRVYGRTGEPCVACGAPIRRMIVGGRSSHFCPRCQKRAG